MLNTEAPLAPPGQAPPPSFCCTRSEPQHHFCPISEQRHILKQGLCNGLEFPPVKDVFVEGCSVTGVRCHHNTCILFLGVIFMEVLITESSMMWTPCHSAHPVIAHALAHMPMCQVDTLWRPWSPYIKTELGHVSI